MTSTAISSAPPRRKTGQLTANPLFQQDAHSIIRRRAKAAGIETRIGNHTFRETGITAYLKPPLSKGRLSHNVLYGIADAPRTLNDLPLSAVRAGAKSPVWKSEGKIVIIRDKPNETAKR
jgi:hypothetical protein